MARNAVLLCIFIAFIAFISTVYAGQTLEKPLPYNAKYAVEFAVDLKLDNKLIASDLEWETNPQVSDTWSPSRGNPFAVNIIAFVASLSQDFKTIPILDIADAVYWEYIDDQFIRVSFAFVGPTGYDMFTKLYTFLNASGASTLMNTLNSAISPAAFRGYKFIEISYTNRYIPAHCYNGEKDENETGVDCGGDLKPDDKKFSSMVCPRCAQGFGSSISTSSGYAYMDLAAEFPPLNMGCETDYDCLSYSKCVDTADYLDSYGDAIYKNDPEAAGLKICSYYSMDVAPRYTTQSSLKENSATSLSILFAVVIAAATIFF